MKNDNIFGKTISISETIGIFSPKILNHPNHKRWELCKYMFFFIPAPLIVFFTVIG